VLVAVRRHTAWLWIGLTATATLNQAFDLARALPATPAVRGALTVDLFSLPLRTWRDMGAVVGLLNVALFLAAIWALGRGQVASEVVE
jgi:hypothetical protein